MTIVLVTGASRGIGLEFVRQYAAAGARVHACCRAPDKTADLQAIAKANDKVVLHALDVADRKAVEALANSLKDEAIDILINNAGQGTPPDKRSDKIDDAYYNFWDRSFQVNALAPFHIAQAFHENLKKGSAKKLINITSQMGSTTRNTGGAWAYRSTKAALNNIMHGLAASWKDDGIVVGIFHPGWVRTDMGGPGATLSPAESIAAMRKLIDTLQPADSGRYLDYSGQELPW